MDVVVKSRHCSLPEEFRSSVEEKLTRLEKLNDRVIRVEVEVSTEKNKRQHDHASRVEITLMGKGPVVRAEAAAEDKTGAFDLALDKLMAQLRRTADRRRVHHGNRRPRSLSEATATVPDDTASLSEETPEDSDHYQIAGMDVQGDGPLVVREKTHQAAPMSLEQALDEMELVGHDFFLFVEVDSGCPSVVYRRHGYDYGVIRLENAMELAHT